MSSEKYSKGKKNIERKSALEALRLESGEKEDLWGFTLPTSISLLVMILMSSRINNKLRAVITHDLEKNLET